MLTIKSTRPNVRPFVESLSKIYPNADITAWDSSYDHRFTLVVLDLFVCDLSDNHFKLDLVIPRNIHLSINIDGKEHFDL